MLETLITRFEPPLLLLACLAVAVALSLWLVGFLNVPVPPTVVERGEQARQTHPAGLGGWLILQVFWVSLSPPLQLFAAWLLLESSFSAEAWQQAQDSIARQCYFVFDALTTTLSMVITAFLVNAFFRKHHRVPRFIILNYALNLLIISAETGLTSLPGAMPNPDDHQYLWYVWAFVAAEACLFIPYLLVSKRVAGTFVRDFSRSPSAPIREDFGAEHRP